MTLQQQNILIPILSSLANFQKQSQSDPVVIPPKLASSPSSPIQSWPVLIFASYQSAILEYFYTLQ